MSYYVIFADGFEGTTNGVTEELVDAVWKVKFKLFPSLPLVLAYNIKNEERNPKYGYIECEYDLEYKFHLNTTENNRRLLLFCNFRGKITKEVQKYEHEMHNLIDYYRKENEILRKSLKRNQFLLKMAMTNYEGFFETMNDIYSGVKKVTGDTLMSSQQVPSSPETGE